MSSWLSSEGARDAKAKKKAELAAPPLSYIALFSAFVCNCWM